MPRTLYILQREPGFTSEVSGEILGVFSDADKATTEAQKRAGFRPKYPGYHGLNEYRVRTDISGGKVKIIQKEIRGEDIVTVGGMNETIYLALEQCSNYMLEIEAFADTGKAWEVCLKFQKERGGANWKDEKRWVDKNGFRHAKARYGDKLEIFNDWHHWYVQGFRTDDLM